MDAEQLLRDVSSHGMLVRLDTGLYRHLSFRQRGPHSWNLWFDIITWPGSLTIHGDMGTWSFSRVDDMFTFFRNSKGLLINASYWNEKVTSDSRFAGPARKFAVETFKANVINLLDGYSLEPDRNAQIVRELEEEVFDSEDESDIRRALADFKSEDFEFSDVWEIRGDAYTYHFLWCLYAIVWGIQQYDAAKEQANPSPVESIPC